MGFEGVRVSSPGMDRSNGSGPNVAGGCLEQEQEIVIVGAGVGGLACALALHRVGMKAVILEQSDRLRAWGSALTLWSNAFRVLDVLGLGDRFRSMFTNLVGWEVLNSRGKSLAKLEFADCEGGPHDLRVVDRKVLLEVLAGELPEGTIRFNSCVTGVKKSESRRGITEVELKDGSTYSAKVVIGFDGINSCIASWMGLPKVQPVGNGGIRGLAIFPEGHKFEDRGLLFVGNGCRSAILPSSRTKVLWFLNWNDSPQGSQNASGEQLSKAEALQQASKLFPLSPMSFIIDNTPREIFFKSIVRHRLNTNLELLVNGGVAVAGDAAHPSTPNMGQGGCMALEDAVVLTQKLYGALRTPITDQETSEALPEHERINQALVEFQRERYERTNYISTRSYRIGRMIHTGWAVVDFFRDWFLIPFVYNKNRFLSHTVFDVGKLPGQLS